MAELIPVGKQPTTRHQPSRLRNEIQPDLTSDSVVQVPHSDFVVPETQLESHQGDLADPRTLSDRGDDIELDGDDMAFIERVKVKRQIDTAALTHGTVFSKKAVMLEHPSVSTSFAFRQPNKERMTTKSDMSVLSHRANSHSEIPSAPVKTWEHNGMILASLHIPS